MNSSKLTLTIPTSQNPPGFRCSIYFPTRTAMAGVPCLWTHSRLRGFFTMRTPNCTRHWLYPAWLLTQAVTTMSVSSHQYHSQFSIIIQLQDTSYRSGGITTTERPRCTWHPIWRICGTMQLENGMKLSNARASSAGFSLSRGLQWVCHHHCCEKPLRFFAINPSYYSLR